jgi:Uncharacterized conserved protein
VGADGLSLDLMRRDKAAQPGLNDFLIVETIKAASGARRQAHLAELRRVPGRLERGERIGAGPVLRAWRSVLIFMSKWFQIESLYKFNAKFCPVWQPRFFVFPSTKDAPQDRAGRARGGGVPGLAATRAAPDRGQARPGQDPA